MAINSNVVSHFFHFRPDDDWSIQSKRRQSYFSELKLVTDNHLSILFTTHTYLTFTFSLINADCRNAAVDPCYGRVIHQTLPSSPLLTLPTRKGLGIKLYRQHCKHADVKRGLGDTSCDERAQALCANFVLQATNAQGLGKRLDEDGIT